MRDRHGSTGSPWPELVEGQGCLPSRAIARYGGRRPVLRNDHRRDACATRFLQPRQEDIVLLATNNDFSRSNSLKYGGLDLKLASGLTARSVIIGTLLCVFMSYWSQYAELVIHGTQISLTYPPIGAFIIFVCLYAISNIGLRALWPPLALTRPELVVIFTMLVISAGISSIDLAQKLIPMITGPYYYATAANHYQELFWEYIPAWMAPSGERVVRGLYEGSARGVPWDAWWVPLGTWTAFTLATYVVMVCLLTLVRRQWIDSEKLLFPLVVVPLEVMAEPERGRLLSEFFRNKIMWIGCAAGFLVHFYNGLPGYIPGLPVLEICQWGKIVPTGPWGRPWSSWWEIRFAVLPLIIGLSFLLTSEVSFSLWAFYWLGKFEQALGVSLGLEGLTLRTPGASFPFTGHQTAGAYLAFAGASLWIARRPIKQIIAAGLGLSSKAPDDVDEPLSYRASVWGLVLGLAFMVGWCAYAGIPILVSLAILLICHGYLLAMTRLVAEAGMPWVAEPDWRSHDIIRSVLPTATMTPKAWTGVGMLLAYTHDMRVSSMPRILQCFKMTEQAQMSNRHHTVAIAIAVLVSIPFSYWAFLEAGYTHGGITINLYRFSSLARQPGIYMERVLTQSITHTDWPGLAIIGYGAAKTIALVVLRMKYLWWPLHPVGYVMSYITYLHREWLSVMIGWASQALLLRYGGHTAYRKMRPFFLGLILGAMLACGLWLLIDGFTGLRDHKILY